MYIFLKKTNKKINNIFKAIRLKSLAIVLNPNKECSLAEEIKTYKDI